MHRSLHSSIATIAHLAAVCALASASGSIVWAADAARITGIEPTVLFPKVKAGEPLRQLARLGIDNKGPAIEARVRIAMPGVPIYDESIGQMGPGTSVKTVHVPDTSRPAELTVELYGRGNSQPLDTKKITWQPQRKWKIYCVSLCHQDLGYGDYPHRMRTNMRHGNIDRALQFCRATDAWDHDSQYRYLIETSEPITSFMATHGQADVEELARRIREGRIQLGALHNTISTEQCGHECLARLFYMTNRHSRDLLGIPKSKTGVNNDVIGLTWPLASLCHDADLPYFFHGFNGMAACMQPANREAVFYWHGPGGPSAGQVLMRACPYGDNPIPDAQPATIEKFVAGFVARQWPYDALLSQDTADFRVATMDSANTVHAWNANWAWPRLTSATLDMFFDDIAGQVDPEKVKAFAKDENNQWADQDSNDAGLLGQARRLDESIPTAEKFATIAQVVAGGGYPWTDIYQAYHRLLACHEHTNAIDYISPDKERIRRYETELEENREMVAESAEFSRRALDNALERLACRIARSSPKSIIVFNPLTRPRTDLVRIDGKEIAGAANIVDETTGKSVPHQCNVDGAEIFVASEVPALGYKVFRIADDGPKQQSGADQPTAATVLENRFYRIAFAAKTGAITSIRDKQLGVELVDQTAPDQFNQFLYEQTNPPRSNTWARSGSATLRLRRGPVASVMCIAAKSAGVESLRQTVTLYSDLKRIDFVTSIVKLPSGRNVFDGFLSKKHLEAAYLALPLAVPESQFHHELPGCVLEPVRDQFQGSTTDHYAVRHFTDVSNPRYGVTVAPIDNSLVEYDRPQSSALGFEFGSNLVYPKTSRVYLYLLNNMFFVNTRWDQRGPMSFAYSMRSHTDDWRHGCADQFGWDVHNPLLARIVTGKNDGALPASYSFASIDVPNVVCTTVKPAEANGSGMIFRVHETQGRKTTATLSLPFLKPVGLAIETSLIEDDRPVRLNASDGDKIAITMNPFEVKTIRVSSGTPVQHPAIDGLNATPLSDMEIELSWRVERAADDTVSHFRVYRGTTPDFTPGLANLVQRSASMKCVDRPELHYGGWIDNRIEPGMKYFYRVSAVDRWNRESPLSAVVATATMQSTAKNMIPRPIECLRAVVVSPLSPYQNFVTLLWRTSCESDVRAYEVYRSTRSGFAPNQSTRIARVDADAVVEGCRDYGRSPDDHRLRDYDHIMYADEAVAPTTTYYYRVCAVDTAGQKGPYSSEVAVRTKQPESPMGSITAQSQYGTIYGPWNCAMNDIPWQSSPWMSKPYGGGTNDNPNDVWWALELPPSKNVALKSIKLVCNGPLPRRMQLQVRRQSHWTTIGELVNPTGQETTVALPNGSTFEGMRLFVPAADLPQSDHTALNGVVRIDRLLLVLPDGREVSPSELFGAEK